jgi:heavy metal translocating P-type ATPase
MYWLIPIVIGAGFLISEFRESQKKDLQKRAKKRTAPVREGLTFSAKGPKIEGDVVGGAGLPTPLDISRENLKESTALLAIAGVSRLFFPPLLWVTTGFVLHNARFLFREAWDALWHQGKVRAVVIDALFMVVSLLGGWFFMNALIYWFYRLFGYLALKTEDNSRKQLIDVFAKQPRHVWVESDGIEIQVPFESLKTGDVILVSAGELIPVDGVVVGGIASVDQHLLTGEEQLVDRCEGDLVYASTIVVCGKMKVRSLQTGAGTLAAQIGQVLNETNSYAAAVELRGLEIGDKAALPTLGLAAAAFVLKGPSAALPTLTADFGSSMRVYGPVAVLKHLETASKNGIYIKDGRSLELLRKVDMLVFDKTGTLTIARPEVTRVVSWGKAGELDVLRWAAVAEQRLTHPIALAILAEARRREIAFPEAGDDIRFEIGYGVKLTMPEGLIRVGSMRFMDMEKIRISDRVRRTESESHAAGHSLVYVALGKTLEGAVELRPQLRPEAARIVKELRRYCHAMCVISGDHEVPTRRLAKTLGIEQYFAEVLPYQKAEIVERLQAEGKSICFIGDGINDSIALKKANVSVSFHGASTIATDSAQVVLLDNNLDCLRTLFELSYSLDRNMRQNYGLAMVSTGIVVGGVFLFGLEFLGAAVISNVVRILGLANAIRQPRLEQGREHQQSPTERPVEQRARKPSRKKHGSRLVDA